MRKSQRLNGQVRTTATAEQWRRASQRASQANTSNTSNTSLGSLWHVAPQDRRDLIQSEGLRPQPLMDHGIERTFAWDDRTRADRDMYGDRDLWEIDDPDAQWQAWRFPNAQYTTRPIPPDRIKRVERVASPSWYHVAPTVDRERIRTHGLQASDPTWNWTYERPNGTTLEGPDYWHGQRPPQGVYLFDDRDRAQRYVTTLEFKRNAPHDLWRVPSEQVHDPMYDPDMGASYVTHAVSPELVEGPEHREWMPEYIDDMSTRNKRYPVNDPQHWQERVSMGADAFTPLEQIKAIAGTGVVNPRQDMDWQSAWQSAWRAGTASPRGEGEGGKVVTLTRMKPDHSYPRGRERLPKAAEAMHVSVETSPQELRRWQALNQQNVMYHVAPRSRRQAIVSQGLVAEPTQGRQWTVQRPGVYLHDDQERAVSYGDTYPHEGGNDLWAVDASGLHLNPDELYPGAYSVEVVGPERLSIANAVCPGCGTEDLPRNDGCMVCGQTPNWAR